MRVRQLAGWREDLEAPAPDARHAVTLAIKQDRAAILAALATTSDPDSPQYGQHYTHGGGGGDQHAEALVHERARVRGGKAASG